MGSALLHGDGLCQQSANSIVAETGPEFLVAGMMHTCFFHLSQGTIGEAMRGG